MQNLEATADEQIRLAVADLNMFIRQKKITDSSYSPIVQGTPVTMESSAYDDFFSEANFGKDKASNWSYLEKTDQITKVEEGKYELEVIYKNKEYEQAKGKRREYTVYLTNSDASLEEISGDTKMLTSIEISTQPTKKEYKAGDTFDKAGMKIIARYDDGTTADVTSSCIVNNGEALTEGQTSVEVKYRKSGITKTVLIEGITVTKSTVEISVQVIYAGVLRESVTINAEAGMTFREFLNAYSGMIYYESSGTWRYDGYFSFRISSISS